MKTRKTRSDARNTFTYRFADGTSVVLTPGVDGVTEADIAMLHRMDDREVENNNGEWKPKLQPWQKEYVEDWKERHPEEDVPSMARLSTDALMNTDNPQNDDDKSTLAYIISMAAEEDVSAETQAVRDFVEIYLNERQQVVYQRVLIDGDRLEDVAADLGISYQAVSKCAIRVKKIFKENFKKFLGEVEK
ncbi:MAG: hypothetical protein LUH14_05875 [Clostridiaceae bacterium]|nr:hypothetical protein [Clostridiaceae bacterium]